MWSRRWWWLAFLFLPVRRYFNRHRTFLSRGTPRVMCLTKNLYCAYVFPPLYVFSRRQAYLLSTYGCIFKRICLAKENILNPKQGYTWFLDSLRARLKFRKNRSVSHVRVRERVYRIFQDSIRNCCNSMLDSIELVSGMDALPLAMEHMYRYKSVPHRPSLEVNTKWAPDGTCSPLNVNFC